MLERHGKGQVQSHTANLVSHSPAILGAQFKRGRQAKVVKYQGFWVALGALGIGKEVSPPPLLGFRWWGPLPPGVSSSAYTWTR